MRRYDDGNNAGSAYVLLGSYFYLGDFDPDGNVDGSDLSTFAADFGRTDCDIGEPCEGDFDGNNIVDENDLTVFALDFGNTIFP